MVRVKRGNIARKKRKKILKMAKGFTAAHSCLFRTAKQQVLKSLKYAYVGRKQKKRQYRRLWITRINAGLIHHGLSYSKFINLLKINHIALNRKILSQLIILDNKTFNKIVTRLYF